VGRNEPPPRPPLRREAIVAEARALIAEHGIDALSIRRLAGRLGVSAPALYAHVRDKDDLLGAVATIELDELASRFEAVAVADANAESSAGLRGLAEAYLAFARECPSAFELLATTPPGLRGSRAEAILVEAAGRTRAGDPDALAAAVWAGAHGVATVLRLAPAADLAEEQRRLAAVIDPLLTSERRGGRGSR
jgi:AcrR family transcriptional regulator